MSTTKQMWLWAVLLPAFFLLCQSMCVWPAPRFLELVALALVFLGVVTVFFVLAAVPTSLYFAVTGLIYWKKEGELVRRVCSSLACLCFIGLWILALFAGQSLRHRAFVEASLVGDKIVQAIAAYRNDKGEYPERLDQLIPEYLNEIPYTGMIAYSDFTYTKDYNDMEPKPGEYELRINCTSGGINFDRFIYWPSEKYPDKIQGKWAERIRSWAYVHE